MKKRGSQLTSQRTRWSIFTIAIKIMARRCTTEHALVAAWESAELMVLLPVQPSLRMAATPQHHSLSASQVMH